MADTQKTDTTIAKTKQGNWYINCEGKILFCYADGRLIDRKETQTSLIRDVPHTEPSAIVTHLPDCDGWDYEPLTTGQLSEAIAALEEWAKELERLGQPAPHAWLNQVIAAAKEVEELRRERDELKTLVHLAEKHSKQLIKERDEAREKLEWSGCVQKAIDEQLTDYREKLLEVKGCLTGIANRLKSQPIPSNHFGHEISQLIQQKLVLGDCSESPADTPDPDPGEGWEAKTNCRNYEGEQLWNKRTQQWEGDQKFGMMLPCGDYTHVRRRIKSKQSIDGGESPVNRGAEGQPETEPREQSGDQGASRIEPNSNEEQTDVHTGTDAGTIRRDENVDAEHRHAGAVGSERLRSESAEEEDSAATQSGVHGTGEGTKETNDVAEPKKRRELVFWEEALQHIDHDNHECMLRSPAVLLGDGEKLFREVLPGDPTPEEVAELRRDNAAMETELQERNTERDKLWDEAKELRRERDDLRARVDAAEEVILAYRHWEHCSGVSQDDPDEDDTATMLIEASFASQEYMEQYAPAKLRGEGGSDE